MPYNEGWPYNWCAICIKIRERAEGLAQQQYELHPEAVIIPVARAQIGRSYTWRPYKESIGVVPVDAAKVHISGAFSMAHIETLLRRCPQLSELEIAPSLVPADLLDSIMTGALAKILELHEVGLRAYRIREYSVA